MAAQTNESKCLPPKRNVMHRDIHARLTIERWSSVVCVCVRVCVWLLISLTVREVKVRHIPPNPFKATATNMRMDNTAREPITVRQSYSMWMTSPSVHAVHKLCGCNPDANPFFVINTNLTYLTINLTSTPLRLSSHIEYKTKTPRSGIYTT